MYVYVITSNLVELVYCVDWTTVCDHRMGLFGSSDIHLWADARYLWSEGAGHYRNGPDARSENHECAIGAR